MLLACLFISAYVLGAVPFGVLIARAHGVDLTAIGSGNIGATNVKRALGLGWATLVFLLDMLKGFGPVMLARSVDEREWIWYLVGIAAVAGHCASPFLRFRGGKGVATSLGMVFAGSPIVAGSAFGVFVILLAITRFVSLSSVVGVGSAILVAALLRDWVYVGIGTLLFMFVLYTHRGNIRRLLSGTESRFSLKKDRPPDKPESDRGTDFAAGRPTGPTPRAGTAVQEPPARSL